MTKPAILLMSFGLPSDINQLTTYYRRIQHGRFAKRQAIRRIAQKYEMLGGIDYFSSISYQQGAGVAALLHHLGIHCPISLAFLHTQPSIESRIKILADSGVTDIYGLPMCTYYANCQTEEYHRVVTKTLKDYPGITYHRLNGLWNQPSLLAYWQDQLIAAKRRHPWKKEDTQLLFIADELPKRGSANDPYRHSVELNARRISHMLGLTQEQYSIGWVRGSQSFINNNPLPHSLKQTVRHQVINRNGKTIVVVPVGFLADSLILDYDVCVTLRQFIQSLGASMVQLPVPNASSDLIKAIAHKLILAMDHRAINGAKPVDYDIIDENKRALAE